ncbi:MAG: hypothetical protein A2928_02445 [Candidatus Taylorbacteria bacterium RIFCSPLOWO2_01_FULL_45_15b]|uniref:DUF5671 domain-containing protein n=1 Tax=Candidatus Taylorbacteria bacterium RIFCSPLOWO2_01_FULL_45_15b TaxID=1802319 RepID=A0A1G2ND43_9BACT|nr:MAG: hypothetical protein A2928_02445 [Candidatus Taylorbacteria bacterium RIFCSPLOWO2_01_FULL_45_15b]
MSIAPFLNKLNEYILNPLILLMFAVALLVFFWGLLRLIWYSDSDEERDTGRRVIVWGIVGMLIMISVYGIINLLLSTFGISTPDYIR